MKKTTYIYLLFLMLFSAVSYGQVQITRQVIGSAGAYHEGTTMSVSSTVGEAVVKTVGIFSVTKILTQGFQQPQTLSDDDVLDYEVINESCPGAKNGSIYINSVRGCAAPYTVDIYSINSSAVAFPVEGDTLIAGDYTVIITGELGCTYTAKITVGLDNEDECLLKFYTGITPNNDGVNDTWIIDEIEQFPINTVQIFNRWGNEVWFGENYDNTTVVWKGDNKRGEQLGSATYFYVAIVEGRTYKGWVEVTR